MTAFVRVCESECVCVCVCVFVYVCVSDNAILARDLELYCRLCIDCALLVTDL